MQASPRGLIVASAPLTWTVELAALARAAVPLLAADGGANHLARLGLRPAAVVGDFDSIRPSIREWLGEELMVPRPDQDRTDLEKALEHAFEAFGIKRLTVLGALGGRVDHTVGNLGLLARLALGPDLVLREAQTEVLAVAGELELAAEPGLTWSVWTFDSGVRVTLEGFRWPVRDLALDAGGRPSISNLAESDRVRVVAVGGAAVITRHLTPPSRM
jgi:thiamine pyrophosphokinase